MIKVIFKCLVGCTPLFVVHLYVAPEFETDPETLVILYSMVIFIALIYPVASWGEE